METTVFTYTILGGTLTTGAIRYELHLKCRNNNNAVRTPVVKVKYGASDLGAFAQASWVLANPGGAGAAGTSYLFIKGIIQFATAVPLQAQCVWWKYIQILYSEYDSGRSNPPTAPANQDQINTSTSGKDLTVNQDLVLTFAWNLTPNVDPSAQVTAAYVEILQ